MYLLYRFAIRVVVFLLPIIAIFSKKLKRAVDGRKELFDKLRSHYDAINSNRKKVVIHVASFGELEQAKPIIARLQSQDTTVHIHLTFFSPSGFDNAKGKYLLPDLISYLPFDTKGNARKFIEITKPDLFIFVRYDVWHSINRELHTANIPMLLICATMDEAKARSFSTRSLYRETYNNFQQILAIRETDKQAMVSLGVNSLKISVCGDTRFDQVVNRKEESLLLNQEILLSKIIESIKRQNKIIIVVGSSWEVDERMWSNILKHKELAKKIYLIVVPHEVGTTHITILRELFPKSILFSDISVFQDEAVIIVDSIGKLFSLYQYADLAYIGGGFGVGVHNTLEAAVWGCPLIVGPNHQRSREISELLIAHIGYMVSSEAELSEVVMKLILDDIFRKEAAIAAKNYVMSRVGAVEKIMNGIAELN